MPGQTRGAKWVLLLHELPDGGSHFDWLLERPGQPGAKLVSFRLAERPDLSPGPLTAQRTPDHRREYLDYEGDVSGGRGKVVRVAQGTVLLLRDEPGEVIIAIDAPGVVWRGAPEAGGGWLFTRE